MSFEFRPLGRGDLGLLAGWLAAPHVQEWWGEDPDLAAVEARYGPGIDGDDPTEYFIVERAGVPFGFVQRYQFADEPGWVESLRPTGAPLDGAGVDYLIADPAQLGRGLGTALLAEFVADTWRRYPEVPALVVDVDPANRRSWRALERLGFERVWEGDLEAEDPADAGSAVVYVLERPTDSSSQAR